MNRKMLKNYTNVKLDKKIEIKLTWRLIFYILYVSMVIFLISNAILNQYENRMFRVFTWFTFIMSYPFSIFLIQWREVV